MPVLDLCSSREATYWYVILYNSFIEKLIHIYIYIFLLDSFIMFFIVLYIYITVFFLDRKRLPSTTLDSLPPVRRNLDYRGEAGVARGLLQRATRINENVRRLTRRLEEEKRRRNEVLHEARRRLSLAQEEAASQELSKFL